MLSACEFVQKENLLSLIPRRFRNPIYSVLTAGSVAGLTVAAVAEKENRFISGRVFGVNNEDRLPGARLPWAAGETWHNTAGPHSDGDSGGIEEAADFTPAEKPVPCTSPSIKSDKFARAVAEGTVVRSGRGTNRRNTDWSVVEIEHETIRLAYEHLADIQVSVGQKVEAGSALGKPSCEVSPGGRTTGLHVHIEEKDEYGRPQPIDDLVLGGWQVHQARGNYEGTMTKEGEQMRTANEGRCGPDAESIRKCGGIRNDLTWYEDDNPDALIKPTLALVPTAESVPTEAPPTFEVPTPGPASFICSTAPESGFIDINGNDVKIESFRGKVVLLFDYFRPESPSRKVVGYLKQLESELESEALLVTTFESDSHPSRFEKGDIPGHNSDIEKIQPSPILYPNDDLEFSSDYRTRGHPVVILIDKDGQIVDSAYGTTEIQSPEFRTAIQNEVNGSGKC